MTEANPATKTKPDIGRVGTQPSVTFTLPGRNPADLLPRLAAPLHAARPAQNEPEIATSRGTR